ncbi:MAG: phage tail protein, partial [Ignavibacteriota bacterium]
ITTLLWPTEYFLPEKGKMYTWSVQALDPSGSPFVLENNGWATPFTFSVGSDCDVNGTSGLLVTPQVLDFGSQRVSSGPLTRRVTLQNIGSEPIALHLPTLTSGAQDGFSLSSPPTTPILSPATMATFDVTFEPKKIGAADGSVRIVTDAGTFDVALKGEGVSTSAPTLHVISPAGGENVPPGSPYKISFSGTDNDQLSDYSMQLSTDGGQSFGNLLYTDGSFAINPMSGMWNVAGDLHSSKAIIRILGKDKGGNSTSAVSGVFSIGGDGANLGDGANNDPNQDNLTSGNSLYDPRTSYRFIPLGAEFVPNSPMPDLGSMMPQFSVHVPPGHKWIFQDEKGNSYPFAIQIPEQMNFHTIPPPQDDAAADFTGGSSDQINFSPGGGPNVNIQPISQGNGANLPAIQAYFNPKEIGVDKSVPWQRHKNTKGDEPTLEFTSSDPKNFSVELMFDMFEEKKSVSKQVEGLLDLGKSHSSALITIGKMPPTLVRIDSVHSRYTIFLPDATPVRAKVDLYLHPLDSPSGGKRTVSDNKVHHNEMRSYVAGSGGAAPGTLPPNAEALMSDPSSKGAEGILIGLLKGLKKSGMSDLHSNPMYESRMLASQGYRYRVDIEGGGTAFFKSVDGLKTETELSAYQEGGSTDSQSKLIGATKWKNIVLKRGIAASPDDGSRKFFAAAAVKSTTNKKGISITVYDKDGAPRKKYNFFDCFPVKWEGPDLDASNNEVAIESVEIAHEGVEVVGEDEIPGGKFEGIFTNGRGAFSPQLGRMTFTVPTQIDGTPANILVTGLLELPSDQSAAAGDTKKLSGHSPAELSADLPGGNWISGIVGPADDGTGDESGNGSGEERSYAAGHFLLELDGKQAAYVKSIEGGGIKAELATEPGQPITLEVIPTSMEIYDWIKSSFNGNFLRKSGELQAADFKRDVRQVREFRDALLTEIGFPACDGSAKDPAYMTLKISPETT